MSYDKKSCAKKGYDKVLDRKDDIINAKAVLDKATSALAEVIKQDKEEEKKHADTEAEFIAVVISGTGYMSKCHVPTAAVAQYGLYTILFGTAVVTEDVVLKQPSDFDGWSTNIGNMT